MVIVDAVSQLPTGGPIAEVRGLALFCIHRVNQMNSRNDSK